MNTKRETVERAIEDLERNLEDLKQVQEELEATFPGFRQSSDFIQRDVEGTMGDRMTQLYRERANIANRLFRGYSTSHPNDNYYEPNPTPVFSTGDFRSGVSKNSPGKKTPYPIIIGRATKSESRIRSTIKRMKIFIKQLKRKLRTRKDLQESNPFQLTEAKLKQMILEAMYAPRTLVKDALVDPDVHPQIKNLLSSADPEDKKQGLSLLQTLYPEKYETDIKLFDPERAEMAAQARKGVKGRVSDSPASIVFDDEPSYKQLLKPRIDTSDYEHEFKQRNKPIIRLNSRVKMEYRKFQKMNTLAGYMKPPLIVPETSKYSHNYNTVTIYSDFTKTNLKLMSSFAKFLEQKGYFISEIEDEIGVGDNYIFKVFLDQQSKESYTPIYPL